MSDYPPPPFEPNSRKFLYKSVVPVELWSVGVQINYDPTERKARVLFQAQGMTIVNGVPIVLPSVSDSLETDLGSQATRCFGYGLDPVTGADLSKVSIAGLDRIISCAFDTLHNERAFDRAAALEAINNPPPPVMPTAPTPPPAPEPPAPPAPEPPPEEPTP